MDAPGTVRYEDDDIVIEGSVGGPYMVEKIVGIYMGKVCAFFVLIYMYSYIFKMPFFI